MVAGQRNDRRLTARLRAGARGTPSSVPVVVVSCLSSSQTMSDEPHLPGYSVDDDDPHGEPPTSEPESSDDVILVASSAGARDAIRAVDTTVSTTSQPVSTQPTPTPPGQQQAEERELRGTNTASTSVHTTSATTTATTPPLPERPAVDDFADPKIASLHAIFPDYDAALL
jgi:hypothetical protein